MLTPRQIAIRFLLVAVVAGVYMSMIRLALMLPQPTDSLQIRSAAVESNGASTTVSLPHDWMLDDGLSQRSSLTYITTFELTHLDQAQAIYFPHVVMSLELALNGRSLGSQGGVDQSITRGWARPLLFTIADTQLQRGSNVLRIRVYADNPGTGLLGAFWIGPLPALEAAYQGDRLVRVSLAEMAFSGTAFLGLLMVLLWLLRRHDSVYLWYAAGLITWAIHDLNLFALEPLLPLTIWRWVVAASLLWLGIFSVMFVLRFLDQHKRWFERSLLGSGLLLTIAMPWYPLTLFHPARWPAIETWALIIAIYPTWLMLKAFAREHGHQITVVMYSGSCMMASSIHDWLVVMNILPRTYGYTLHYSALVVVLAFSYVLLLRFSKALNQAEQLNLTLEQRVADKSEQLEHNYALLAESQRRAAAVEERQRLLRDMHDGVGSQLVAALAISENESATQTTAAIHHVLDDLRLILDATAPDASFGAALASLRQRLTPHLAAAGIALEWQIQGSGLEWAPEKRLQLLRIVQEALTNAIKHSGGDCITLSSQPHHGQGWKISVRDNGCGISNVGPGGRGLDNMRQRAQSIGAQLNFSSAEPGTDVTIIIR